MSYAHNAFVALDSAGHVTYWNGWAQELFGVSRERALGGDLVELIAPVDDRDRHRAALGPADADESGRVRRRLQLEGVRGDRSGFPIEVTLGA